MKNLMQVIILAVVIFTTACSKMGVEGSGNVISEKRTLLGNFDKISVSDIIHVTLIQGDSVSVIAKDDDNLLPLLVTRVQNNVLMIRHADNTNIRNSSSQVIVTVPQLKEIDMSGISSFETSNTFNFNDLNIFDASTGALRLTGKAKNMVIKKSGTGKLFTLDCPSSTVDITNSGTGNSQIAVEKELSVQMSGTGDIHFKGNPIIKAVDNRGTGKLLKM